MNESNNPDKVKKTMSPVPKEDREKPVDDNPECNNVENDENIPEFIISLTSSESETESDIDIEYDGYELLPQDAEPEYQPPIEIHEISSPMTPIPPDPVHIQNTLYGLPLTIPETPIEDAASLLWNQANPADRTEMDKGQEDRVRAAMKGFQLPSSNIPDWAKNVPEDKWKEHLLAKLEQLNTRTSDDKEQKPDDSSQNDDSCLK